ncbi:unnamed protein product [Cladocopium goreaui]|uniref:Uncharacterized protein n=1 Tax=Cladocopium goreaui TaxID=2562237 RepID=A0A9P1G9L0_9DINO|nr:unnamed protein product [Cladocopium goreaui]
MAANGKSSTVPPSSSRKIRYRWSFCILWVTPARPRHINSGPLQSSCCNVTITSAWMGEGSQPKMLIGYASAWKKWVAYSCMPPGNLHDVRAENRLMMGATIDCYGGIYSWGFP